MQDSQWARLAQSPEFRALWQSEPIQKLKRNLYAHLRNPKARDEHEIGYTRGQLQTLDLIEGLPERMANIINTRNEEAGGEAFPKAS